MRHQRALEGHVEAVAQRMLAVRQRLDVLFHGGRFTGECRLVDAKLRHLVQPQVGRHEVAGLQQHHVTRHQLGCFDALRQAAATHGGLRRGEALKRLEGAFGSPLLRESDRRVEQHDDDDGHGVGRVADESGQHGRGQQHQHHEVAELVEDAAQQAARRRIGQPVLAVHRAPLRGFGGCQAAARIDLESFGHEVGAVQVRAVGLPVAGAAGGRRLGRLPPQGFGIILHSPCMAIVPPAAGAAACPWSCGALAPAAACIAMRS
jgi:hypothetical protein